MYLLSLFSAHIKCLEVIIIFMKAILCILFISDSRVDVLLVGLGGGSLARYLHDHFSNVCVLKSYFSSGLLVTPNLVQSSLNLVCTFTLG